MALLKVKCVIMGGMKVWEVLYQAFCVQTQRSPVIYLNVAELESPNERIKKNPFFLSSHF